MEDAELEVHRPVAYEPGKFKDEILSAIKRSGHRIMILLGFDEDLKDVASSARRQGLTAGWGWVSAEPLLAGALETTQGWLVVRPLLPSEGMQAFAKQVSDYTKSKFNISTSPDSVDLTYSLALHEAVMLYAHAATKVAVRGRRLRRR